MALTYAIAIVFPIVGCFFLVFGLMEDSGPARLARDEQSDFQEDGAQRKSRPPHVLDSDAIPWPP